MKRTSTSRRKTLRATDVMELEPLVPGLTNAVEPSRRLRRWVLKAGTTIDGLFPQSDDSASGRLAAQIMADMAEFDREATVVDLFCGAGGTSTGALLALRDLGIRIKLAAINHNRTAIATHLLSHPEADHYCEDVEAVRPEDVVPSRHLHLLLASPTCTYHSRARGDRPIHDQQRMDPWIVVRWLTSIIVDRLIVENVPEFVHWGPCVDGKPVKQQKGQYFTLWLRAIKGAGYKVKWKIINAADYGDGTTRKRFFLIARRDGKRLIWPEETHTENPASGDIFVSRRQPWRVSRSFIDWSTLGTSVFTRQQDGKKPLKPKTIRRIIAGALKYGWPQVYIDALWLLLGEPGPAPRQQAGSQGDRAFVAVLRNHACQLSLDAPLSTISTSGAHHALVHAVLSPLDAAPMTLSQHFHRPFRTVDAPLSTVVGRAMIGLYEPIVTPYYGSGSGTSGTSVSKPLPTCTTKSRFGLASPCLVPVTHGKGAARTISIDRPIPTITTAHGGEFALAQPFLVPQFGERGDQTPRTHSLDSPLPAVTSHGAGALAAPILTPADGEISEGTFVDPYGRLVTTADGQLFMIDVLFRMLQPAELAAAMSFTSEEIHYLFVGTKTEVVKQIGNAVPVKTAAALVGALMRE